MEIGVPVVTWAAPNFSSVRSSEKTPERIFTASGSWRWVTNVPWPGRRFSSQTCTSAAASAIPGGQPSTTQPRAGPWLSPQVVTRNRWPKVLCDMGGLLAVKPAGRQSGRPHYPPEEDQRLLQGGHVGRALRDLQVAAQLDAALHGGRGTGRQEVVVPAAGQGL